MPATPKILLAPDLVKFLNYIKNDHHTERQKIMCVRNYAMACLMVEAGLRVGEVVKVRIEHLWFSYKPVTNLIVTSDIAKNHKQREIPVSERLCGSILDLHESFWTIDNRISACNAFSASAESPSLSSRQVERIFNRAGMNSIGRPVNPHMLRHTFATRLMKVTDMRTVQMLLGHSNLSSTQVYTHPNGEEMRKAIDSVTFNADCSKPNITY